MARLLLSSDRGISFSVNKLDMREIFRGGHARPLCTSIGGNFTTKTFVLRFTEILISLLFILLRIGLHLSRLLLPQCYLLTCLLARRAVRADDATLQPKAAKTLLFSANKLVNYFAVFSGIRFESIPPEISHPLMGRIGVVAAVAKKMFQTIVGIGRCAGTRGPVTQL